MHYYDVIVAGAGPAGSSAAYELAKKGLSVLILEKEKFPRYKVCGGGLSLKVERILNFNIQDIIETTILGICLRSPVGEDLHLISDSPVAHMVMRKRFDSLLVSEAIKAGASFIDQCEVKAISQSKIGYNISAGKMVYKSRYVIGADGANSLIRKYIYPGTRPYISASIEAEIPADSRILDQHNHQIYIDFFTIPHGYAWVFPKKKCLSAGIAGFRRVSRQPKRYFEKFIKEHNVFRELQECKKTGYPIPLFNTPQSLTKGGVLLAGDAGNLVDPFFGEGIYYAIRSAQLASTVIYETMNKGISDLSRYDMLIGTELYSEFKAAKRISQLVYSFPRIWYDLISARPELAEKYFDVLRGKSLYSSFLKEMRSLAGSVTKSVLKGVRRKLC